MDKQVSIIISKIIGDNKRLVKIILCLAVVLIVVYIYKIIISDQGSLSKLEFDNTSKVTQKSDTTPQTVVNIQNNNSQTGATVNGSQKTTNSGLNSKVSSVTKGQSGIPERQVVTGNNNNIVNGVNNGIVGDVTINNAPPPRMLSLKDANKILEKVTSLIEENNLGESTPVSFFLEEGNQESLNYADQIANFLNNNGFPNINRHANISIGGYSEEVEVKFVANSIWIFVRKR